MDAREPDSHAARIFGVMEQEIEEMLPGVERTQDGHSEVIGFLLQDGTSVSQDADGSLTVATDESQEKSETDGHDLSIEETVSSQDTQSSEGQSLQTVVISEGGDQSTTTVQLTSAGHAVHMQVPTFQQTITLPNGNTALIQSPLNPGSKGGGATINTLKLVEGQTVELEDGTMAYVQSSPKLGDGLQAIQLEDGTTAYISSQNNASSVFSDGSSLEVSAINLANLQPAQESDCDNTRVLQATLVSSPSKLSSERALALGDKAYKCAFEGCGRLYTTQHHLKVHARSHTGDRPFRCDFDGCDKAFATGYGLKSHTRVHTGEKPYKCTEESCPKAFKTSGDLQKHLRTHTGERPFKCPFEGCTRSFTTSNIRKVHIRTHTGERPYVCTEDGCMKAFASATNYKNHIRIHTGEKPYVCTVTGCGKRFTEYSSLYKHHVVHTQSKPYICNHCGKNYRQTSTLAMHKRTAHGDDSGVEAEAALVLQQGEGDLVADDRHSQIAFQLVPPEMLQASTASVGASHDDSEGALIINTSEPQISTKQESSHNASSGLLTDDQAMVALQATQQAAQIAIQQLQQGHGITLASDQDGQQIYVVTDPSQLEALQQLAQQQNVSISTSTAVTGLSVEQTENSQEIMMKSEDQEPAHPSSDGADPLTVDEDDDAADVLHYQVAAS